MEENSVIKIHKPFFVDITKFKNKEEAFVVLQRLAFEKNWFWNSSGSQDVVELKDVLNSDAVKVLIFGLRSNNTVTWAKEDYFFNTTNLEIKGLTEILHCEHEEDTYMNILEQLKQAEL